MKNRKHRVEHFLMYDYIGVEAHLKKMATKGWQLVEIEGAYWTYERKEAEKLRYAVVYIPDASEYDPLPAAETSPLDKESEESGWKKVADWAQMQIFCTADMDEPSMVTDEALRLDTIGKTMRKNYLLNQVLALLLFSLQLYLRINHVLYDSGNLWNVRLDVLMSVLSISAIAFLLIDAGYFWGWYHLSKKSIAAGGTCVRVRGHKYLSRFFLGEVIVLAVLICIVTWDSSGALALTMFIGIFLISVIAQKLRMVLRENGTDRGSNQIATTVVGICLILFLFVVLTIIYMEKIR